MRKISSKLYKRLKKENSKKIIELNQLKQSKKEAEQALESIQSVEQLLDQGYHPVYSAYASAQNLLSVIIEGLLQCRELDRFSECLEAAEDKYMPGGPPMSPVTDSYFYTWSCADMTRGLQKESLISIVCDIAGVFKLPPSLQSMFRQFEQSKMSVYLHEGTDGADVLLRELHTDKQFRSFNQSGYVGESGELWLVRLLPDIAKGENNSICFTTPYVFRDNLGEWKKFIKRESWRVQEKGLTYDALLKYGATPTYWLEFITQAYFGVSAGGTAIFLQGVPDQSSTRPHSDIDSTGEQLPDHSASVISAF